MITKKDALALGAAVMAARAMEIRITDGLLKETARDDLYGQSRILGIRAGTYSALCRVWEVFPDSTRASFNYRIDNFLNQIGWE